MWLSAQDIAHVMQLSERYVYNLASAHRWRRVRHGRTVKYHLQDVTDTVTRTDGVSLDQTTADVNNAY